jgi:hypothetical protein|tara:strand:- start:4183 stop:4689 length:507 start_codon:yes stop_codon:yes gene_type:complete
MSIFQEIKELAGNEPRSYSWYRDAVRMHFQQSDIYSDLSGMEETMIPSPGNLYLFEYKATYARKLKFYDEFPLVYVVSGGPKFMGANLHYLRYRSRMNVILGLENGRARFPKQCYHNYVVEGLETPLYKINSEDYKTAIFLPIESFVTRRKGMYQQYSKSAVWGETSQ